MRCIRGLRPELHSPPFSPRPLHLQRVPSAVHSPVGHRDASHASCARPMASRDLADRRLEQKHLGHRIRTMTTNESVVLSGIWRWTRSTPVHHPASRMVAAPSGAKSGRGPRRPLVLTMAERGGHVIFQRIASHSIAAIRGASHNRIAGDAVISTDALPAYCKAVAGWAHIAVKHSAGEFARRDAGGSGADAHTNTAEAVHSGAPSSACGPGFHPSTSIATSTRSPGGTIAEMSPTCAASRPCWHQRAGHCRFALW